MFERRLNWAYAALCAGLLVVLGKLVYLQVFQISLEDPDRILHPPEPWQQIQPWRGPVCDRHGDILAGDRPYLDLAISYPALRYPKFWLRSVADAAGISEEQLLAERRRIRSRVNGIRASIRQRHGRAPRLIYEETVLHTIAQDVSLQAAARIEANPDAFPGIVVRKNFRRDHPHGPLARHVLGYLGRAGRPAAGEIPENITISPGDRVGRAGIEKQFDPYLRGVPGAWRFESPSRRGREERADPLLGGVPAAVRMRIDRRAAAAERLIPFPAQPGRTVWLSIDRRAQKVAEDALSGLQGGVVVLDVHTGDVLVLVSAPADEELNRATQDSVPSGSVIKPIVALAAAMAGKFDIRKTVSCAGSMRLGRRRFRCSHRHGDVSLSPAIAHSCNIYFWELGRKIGPQAIVRTTRDLGFGVKTGIDLPHEWPGHLPTEARVSSRTWYPGSTMNLSIGQGSLRVTPLQVAVAMAAIANGGKVLKPRIVIRIDPEPEPEQAIDLAPKVIRRVAFPVDALKAVREGMRGTVTAGTAHEIPGLSELKAAAKTGTAETNDPNRNHAWLAGFAPFDDPRVAFAVVVHNTPHTGAEAAGPIAADVLDAVLARPEMDEGSPPPPPGT